VIPTTLPPPPDTTVAPSPTVAAEAPAPVLVPGDLGLAQPMTRPPCDDTYITVLVSSLDPATDASVVADALARYPGSSYLKTIETCPSLRPAVDGAEIYVVYFGPFLTAGEACAARSSGPTDSYVRILSLTVPDTHRVTC
jgi:serine/threonine-protein kinase